MDSPFTFTGCSWKRRHLAKIRPRSRAFRALKSNICWGVKKRLFIGGPVPFCRYHLDISHSFQGAAWLAFLYYTMCYKEGKTESDSELCFFSPSPRIDYLFIIATITIAKHNLQWTLFKVCDGHSQLSTWLDLEWPRRQAAGSIWKCVSRKFSWR